MMSLLPPSRLYKVIFSIKSNDIFPYVVLLMVSFVALIWFHGANTLMAVGDYGFQFDPHKYFSLFGWTWDPYVSFGVPANVQTAAALPYGVLLEFFYILGFRLEIIQRIIIVGCLFAIGSSSYFMARSLRLNKVIAMIAALFYMFNPYSMQVIWHLPNGMIQFAYFAAPLLFGITLRVAQVRTGWFSKALLYSFIFIVLTTTSYVGPNYLFLVMLMPIFFLGFLLLLKVTGCQDMLEISFMSYLKSVFVILSAVLLLSSFWLVPFITNSSESLTTSTLAAIVTNSQSYALASVSLIGALSLTGIWSLGATYKGDPFYSWADLYNSWWYQLLLILIPVVMLVSVLAFKRTKNALRKRLYTKFIFFLIIFIFAVILCKGIYPPFAEINNIIYSNSFISAGFRSPYLKWGIILALSASMVIGVGLYVTINLVRNNWLRTILWGALLIAFIVMNLPFLNGDVVYRGGKVSGAFTVTVPQAYYDLRNYFESENNDSNIIEFPLTKTNKTYVKWSRGFQGGYFLKWFSGSHPVLNSDTGRDDYQIVRQIGEDLEVKTFSPNSTALSLANKLKIANVGYVVYHKDANWDYIKNNSWYYNVHQDTYVRALASLNLPIAYENSHVIVYKTKSAGNNKIYRTDHVYNFAEGYDCLGAYKKELANNKPLITDQNNRATILSSEYLNQISTCKPTTGHEVSGGEFISYNKSLLNLIGIKSQNNSVVASIKNSLGETALSGNILNNIPRTFTLYGLMDNNFIKINSHEGIYETSHVSPKVSIYSLDNKINLDFNKEDLGKSRIFVGGQFSKGGSDIKVLKRHDGLELYAGSRLQGLQFGEKRLEKGYYAIEAEFVNYKGKPLRFRAINLDLPDENYKVDFTENQTEKIAYLNIRRAGNYGLYLYNDPLAINEPSVNSLRSISIKSLSKIGDYSLSSELITLLRSRDDLGMGRSVKKQSTVYSKNPNKADAPSYTFFDASGTDSIMPRYTISGESGLKVTTDSRRLGIKKNLNLQLTPGNYTYRINSSSSNNNVPSVAVVLRGKYGDQVLHNTKSNNSGAEVTFTVNEIINSVDTYIYVSGSNGREGSTLIKNISLYRDLSDYHSFIYNEGEGVSDRKYKLRYKKISHTSYEIEWPINKKGILVTGIAHNDKWAAYINGKELPSYKHIVVNGYGNGWLISADDVSTGRGDVTKIIVQYKPQNMLIIGISVTSVCSIFILALTLWHRIDARRKLQDKGHGHHG